jgi:LacI family transcriptional regulator
VIELVTVKEIAEKSGYSTASVSRLLNNDPSFSISEGARAKILSVAGKLGYKHYPETKGQTFNAAVIFAVEPQKELEDVYYNDLRNAIIEASEKANIALTFCRNVDEVGSDMDGFIAIGNFENEELQKLTEIFDHGIFVDSNPAPHLFNAVLPNMEYITEHAVDQFRLAGCQTLGLIVAKFWNAEENNLIEDSRKKYFESYMRELGIYDEEMVFIGRDFSVASGYEIGKKVVEKFVDQGMPDGFLLGSDPLAVGVLKAFEEAGISVPADTAIISINDIDIAKYVSPALTTFKINTVEMAEIAVETLKESIMLPNKSKKSILLDSKLIYRQSFNEPN